MIIVTSAEETDFDKFIISLPDKTENIFHS